MRALANELHLRRLLRYVLVALVAGAITAGLYFFEPPLERATIALIYLLGVLVIATTTGLGRAIVMSVLSFLAFNFFFVTPRYTFEVALAQDALHLITFLTVAVVASSMAARMRTAAERAQHRAEMLDALYQLSQMISAQVDLDQILPVIATTTCRMLDIPACAVLLYTAEGRLLECARVGEFAPQLHALTIPVRAGASVLGILRVSERIPGVGLSPDDLQLLETLSVQTRLAIERARLVEQVAHTQALRESDRLKSALLASVSHDLRTPLAVIKGATSTLLADELSWDANTQRSLTQAIDLQVDHLNRVVGNLLDMSRIEAGTLSTERDWYDLAELIGAALRRFERALDERPLQLDLAPDLPLLSVNAVLIEQVISNLLENALKYTPDGVGIWIAARCTPEREREVVLVTIRDAGPGIPPKECELIFEKFYRCRSGDTQRGAGLGLTICRGMIEAHGGRIWADNHPDGGAQFSFTLPQLGGRFLAAESGLPVAAPL